MSNFKKEKQKLNGLIKYHIRVEHEEKSNKLIEELCNLYIENDRKPNSNFKYIDQYNEMVNSVEESNIIKDQFDQSELKYVKKLMNNSSIQYGQKREILCEELNITQDELDQLFEELGIDTNITHFEKAKFNKLKESKRYLITSAQTASPVNKKVFANMKTYAEFIGAEIGIIATRYKNPTSIWKEEGDVWDEAVTPYLTAMRQDLHEDVCLLADLKIQATSPNPTGRIDSFEGNKSLIVGSPCVEWRSVAVLQKQKQKFVMSTGSITEPSFTDTVAGGKAAEHHNYGFVIMEVDSDGTPHMRNIVCDLEGNFNDLIYRVEDEKVTREDTDTLVWGDSHFAQKDEKVTQAFRNLCKDLAINRSVLHDIWDSQSINVHNIKNPIVQHALAQKGLNNLEKELNQMVDELDWFEQNMKETVVVASNHDDMLDRAMVDVDWRTIPHNAKKFVELLGIKLSGYAKNGIIPYIIENEFNNIKALSVEDSFIRFATELALHGHKGPNGSRGSLGALAKLIIPSISGHNHGGGIKWDCYQVGISCAMLHGYNKGLSGWTYSGVSLNKHGMKQLIVFNKFTLKYTGLY